MYYDRDERRRQRQERKLARRASKQHIPLNVALPVEGLSGAELDAQLRRRAEMRLQQRNDFFKGVVAFIAINALVWTIWAVTMLGGFPWPIFVTFGMGVALASEAVQMYQDSAGVVGQHEDRIQREIEIEKMRLGLASDPYDKPKRGQAMRLSDDGELIPADDDEDMEQAAKPKRS